MIDLGKVLVLEAKHPLELKKVPDRVKTDTIYNYALHQINGTGWRVDYALQALALLQNQELSSYDLSIFKKLRGVDVSDGKIKFNLEEVVSLGYEKIKKEKSDIGLGILKFAQEQRADINPRKLVAYGLRKLQKDLFKGLNLLEEAKREGLIENILTPEVDKFTPQIDVDKQLSENDLRRVRLESYINKCVEELAKQGEFGTVELIPHMYKRLGLLINKEAFEKRIQEIAFSMIQQGNGKGLDYFFPFFHKIDLLKNKDLSKVIEEGCQKLEKGDVEKGVRILSQAKLSDSNVNLTEKQQERIRNYLFNKIKNLRNKWVDSFSLKFYIEDMEVLKMAFNEEENNLLKNTFLEKLKQLREKSFLSLRFFLDSCDYAGIIFDDVCGVAYKKLEKGKVNEGLEILAEALQKYPVDKYTKETGDILFKHFDSRDIAPFKRKIKRELTKKNLIKKILDKAFVQVKDGNYAEGMDNLGRVEYIGIKPNFNEKLTLNEMVDVACKTMETKFMFHYGLKLLKQAVKQGASFDQEIFRYLGKLGRERFC